MLYLVPFVNMFVVITVPNWADSVLKSVFVSLDLYESNFLRFRINFFLYP